MNIENSMVPGVRLKFREATRVAAVMAGTFAVFSAIGMPKAHAQNFVPSPNGTQNQQWVIVDDQIVPASAVIELGKKADSNALSLAPNANKWPGGRVPYAYDASMLPAKRAIFESGCREWEKFANLKFFPRTTETNYINVVSTLDASNSFIGMTGGGQTMNLADWANKYTVMHEMAHALGVIHEQSRPDRDTYVTIHPENIQDGMAFNFAKVVGALNQGAYDFDSFMHYPGTAFSKNGMQTITANVGFTQFQNKMGQRNHVSILDGEGMARIYGSSSNYGDGIAPTQPKTNDILTAKTDDPAATFVWRKNGNVLVGESAKTLDLSKPGNGDKGDRIILELTAKDADGIATTQNSQVTILNSAPVVTAQDFDVENNAVLEDQLSATDDDNDAPLTYILKSNVTNGTLDLKDDGSFTYTPSASFEGVDSFKVAASDGSTAGLPTTFNILVTHGNDDPTLQDASFSIIKGLPFSKQLTGNDINGDDIFYYVSQGSLPVGLQLSYDGTISGTPTTVGVREVTIGLYDYNGGFGSAKVTFTVKEDDRAPSVRATFDPAVLKTNDTVKVNSTVTNPSGGDVTVNYKFSVNGKLIQTGASNSFNLAIAGYGDKGDVVSCEVTATNAGGGVGTATASATIINSDPTGISGSGVAEAGVETGFVLKGFDADGDALRFTITGAPANGQAELRLDPTDNVRKLFYRSKPGYRGIDVVRFTVAEEGGKQSGVSTFAINVKYTAPPVNRAPVAGNTNVDTFVGESVVKGLLGSDPDGDELTFRIVNNAKYGTSEIKRDTDGKFKLFYTSLNRFYGNDAVTYIAIDSKGKESNVATVFIKFGNRAPSAQGAELKVVAGVETSQFLFGTDPDGDELTFRMVNNPRYGKAEIKRDEQGKWRVYYTALPIYTGSDRLTFIAIDPQGKQSQPTEIKFTVVRVTPTPSASGALQRGGKAPSAGNS